jgi:DNA-binding CsgD family transcriptional regulator
MDRGSPALTSIDGASITRRERQLREQLTPAEREIVLAVMQQHPSLTIAQAIIAAGM